MTEQILELIEKKDFKQLKNVLAEMLVPDIAAVLEAIHDKPSVMIIFRLLPKSCGIYLSISNVIKTYINFVKNCDFLRYLFDKIKI